MRRREASYPGTMANAAITSKRLAAASEPGRANCILLVRDMREISTIFCSFFIEQPLGGLGANEIGQDDSGEPGIETGGQGDETKRRGQWSIGNDEDQQDDGDGRDQQAFSGPGLVKGLVGSDDEDDHGGGNYRFDEPAGSKFRRTRVKDLQ